MAFTRVTVASLPLADGASVPGPFTFDVGDDVVLIPGYGGGRDGPTEPERPEQEAWMRSSSGLQEVWYLTWTLPDAAAKAGFMALIQA